MGKRLALSDLLVVVLRLQCLGSGKDLCMSPGGADPLMEATPSLEVKGVAKYHSFKMGLV